MKLEFTTALTEANVSHSTFCPAYTHTQTPQTNKQILCLPGLPLVSKSHKEKSKELRRGEKNRGKSKG